MSQDPPLPEPLSGVLDLRAALEQMRKEAEREITRLNRKLADRELEAESRVVSATESLALQQQLATLRGALAQKETALERITGECRHLEDQLEDRHLAFDDLMQKVERKESSLIAAREEVDRLQRQLAELQAQSIDLSGPPSAPPDRPELGLAEAPAALAPPSGAGTSLRSFSLGILSALVMVGVFGLLIAGTWGFPWSPGGALGPVVPDSGAATTPRPKTETPDQGALADTAAADPAEAAPVVVRPSPPSGIRILRDPLASGGQAPTLSLLAGGTFRMGLNNLVGGDTTPEHDVQTGAFGIGTHEVTFEQYDRFARATGRHLPEDYGWGRGDRPVVGVSWSDAEAYTAWLSQQTGHHYRLPSEAEWELAARSGGRGSYWWGFGLEPGRALCFDCGSPWDNRSTAPVGSFRPSPFGLYDTAGNVMEWVADCYHPGYQGAPADGRARQDPGCRLRSARGGAFNKPSASMRAYVRTKLDPETRLNNLGFRVARDP